MSDLPYDIDLESEDGLEEIAQAQTTLDGENK